MSRVTTSRKQEEDRGQAATYLRLSALSGEGLREADSLERKVE